MKLCSSGKSQTKRSLRGIIEFPSEERAKAFRGMRLTTDFRSDMYLLLRPLQNIPRVLLIPLFRLSQLPI